MNTKKMLFEQVLDNNPRHPVILAGNTELSLPSCVFMPADIAERELFIPSDWSKALDFEAQRGKAYLLIEGLDKLAPAQQRKFCMLLKNRRAGNYKLPDNVSIVIPVADKSGLSAEILSLSLLWDVE
ncbi:MAG: hypothetical protein J6K65_02875 [Alphaproteobacteria bacterium]|nr:hypothetical protein [Alphaproteobacteria bacterium]